MHSSRKRGRQSVACGMILDCFLEYEWKKWTGGESNPRHSRCERDIIPLNHRPIHGAGTGPFLFILRSVQGAEIMPGCGRLHHTLCACRCRHVMIPEECCRGQHDVKIKYLNVHLYG